MLLSPEWYTELFLKSPITISFDAYIILVYLYILIIDTYTYLDKVHYLMIIIIITV